MDAGLISDKIAGHIHQPYEKKTFYGGIRDIKEELVDQLLGRDDPETGETRAEATEEGYTRRDIKDE